ncbi:MAG: putative aminohydrolase SsnA [Chloroflexi bacterium]|nr:putative aminohydrolase SsnA [Chloroflexota bacterium]
MLITNANLITWGKENQILVGYALLIKDGLIVEVGLSSELIKKHTQVEILDALGQYVMPGNICAHTHFYGAYARGLSIPGVPPKDFPEILEKLWWPLDKALDEDSIQSSALIHLIDAIRNGTTTLIDHHASPNAIPGSLDFIADAVNQSGLRAVLCYEVTDRDGEEVTQAGIDENVRFIERTRKEFVADGRIAATFGLHASLTLSDATLDACRAAAPDDVGFHIHVAEHEVDEEDSLSKSGVRVVERLHQHGILGPRSIVAHAVHINEDEQNILQDTQTWVTHQPRSNMNNAVGVAEVEAMLQAGIPVCLGNDGFTQDMWSEWKTAYLLHKAHHRDPRRMSGMDIIKMGVTNNAALAGSFFPTAPLGEISVGAHADLIFVDYHPHTPLTPENLPWQILFGFNENMITTTIVAGRVLMQDHKLLTMDEQSIADQALSLAPEVWNRYHQFANSTDQ